MANPLLDFDRLLLIRRKPHGDPRRPDGHRLRLGEYIGLPRQSSKCNPGHRASRSTGTTRSPCSRPSRPDGQLTTLYQPDGRRLITDVDLHWDADRLLFSMPGSSTTWQVFEIGADGRGLRQLTPGDQPDVHSYDACYLPNGRIAFISTAPLQGVPCNAGVIVGMMYQMDADGRNIRQVCFEQDHDYCPTVLNDGRILYLRWDYTDTPHVWNRDPVHHEPGRHRPDGVLRREFLLAQRRSSTPGRFPATRPRSSASSPGTTWAAWANWWSSIRPRGGARPTASCSGSPATARRSSR